MRKFFYQDNSNGQAADIVKICCAHMAKTGRKTLISTADAIKVEIKQGVSKDEANGKTVEGSFPWYEAWRNALKDSNELSLLPPFTQLYLHRIAPKPDVYNPSMIMRAVKNPQTGEPMCFKNILYKDMVIPYIRTNDDLTVLAFKACSSQNYLSKLASVLNQSYYAPTSEKLLPILLDSFDILSQEAKGVDSNERLKILNSIAAMKASLANAVDVEAKTSATRADAMKQLTETFSIESKSALKRADAAAKLLEDSDKLEEAVVATPNIIDDAFANESVSQPPVMNRVSASWEFLETNKPDAEGQPAAVESVTNTATSHSGVKPATLDLAVNDDTVNEEEGKGCAWPVAPTIPVLPPEAPTHKPTPSRKRTQPETPRKKERVGAMPSSVTRSGRKFGMKS